MEDLNKYLDNLVDVVKSIPFDGRISILTGSNASGKSLVRKLINTRCVEDDKLPFAQWSMQKRTESNPEMGALSSMTHDSAWTPTSSNTVHGMMQLAKWKVGKERVLVIDEPELGCSEELQYSIASYILSLLNDKTIKSLVIITHSRIIVSELKKYSHFFNLEGLKTSDEWMNRKIVPLTLDALEEKSTALFKAVRDRQRSVKSK